MNILVVDDHPMILESWSTLLPLILPDAKMHTALNGKQAFELIPSVQPDVILLDVSMPDLNGFEIAKQILANTTIKIIMFTNVDGDGMVLNLVKAGVHGFLFKNVAPEELRTCIEKVVAGEKYFCETVFQIIGRNQYVLSNIPQVQFDPTELRIIRLLVEEKTSKEIAHILKIKDSMINSYRDGLLKKTKTRNVAGLVAYLIRNGVV